MEIYLFNASVCLVILYSFHKLILRNETNHQIQRFTGLLCIIFACLYVFIPLGSLMIPDTYPEAMNAVFIQGSEGIQEGISRVITEDHTRIYITLYLLGVIVFSLQSLFGLFTLIRWYLTSEKTKQWGFIVVKVKKEIAPFTFFNLLFMGNEVLEDDAMEKLIVHEQYHRDQYHSIDTLLLEILVILFWFNPVVWLFRKDMKTFHEYLADAQVLRKGFNLMDYQYLLFQTNTGVSIQLGNHFSHKTNLKKRIMMMNQKKTTSKKGPLKVLLFLPVMGAILLVSGFSQANHNLSKELQFMQKENSRDTVPIQKELEDEQFQFKLRKAYEDDQSRLKPLFILVEGKKERTIKDSYMRGIDPDQIKTVHVLKGEAARKKYGKKGKNGVVIIVLKEN
jgi:hypothetical protein